MKIVTGTLKIIALFLLLQFAMFCANEMLNNGDELLPERIVYSSRDHQDYFERIIDTTFWSSTYPDKSGIWWLRAYFNLDEHPYPERQKEVVISILGSYEAYFNGVHIGNNGVVSSSKNGESIGQLDNKFILPKTLTKGEGVLALRISSHHNPNTYNPIQLRIDSYNEFYKKGMIRFMLLFSLAGIFIIVALFYFFLYFVSKRKVGYLIFGVFCFVLFLLIGQTYSRYYWPYGYDKFNQWLFWSNTLSLIAASLLPIFLTNSFEVPRKHLFNMLSLILIVSAHYVFASDETAALFISILIGASISIWAIFKGRSGAWQMLLGLLVAISGMMYLNISIFGGYAILTGGSLYALAVKQRREKQLYEASELKSARLELDLLKKNIKPHFLMNTLTNIVSLIESEPKTGIKLIESLAEEFYLMNDISDKKLIPISQELKLCRSHIEVMQIRNDVDYVLNSTVEVGDLWVPPAIIHTMVENGITHCKPMDGKIQFDLSAYREGTATIISFKTRGTILKKSDHVRGTGLKYIESRLQESYPNKWRLNNHPINSVTWLTQIKILQ